jgi:hypothetical protein
MSTHTLWSGIVTERIWPAARAFAVRATHALWTFTIRWVAAPLAAQLHRAVARPLRIAAGGLLGMVYAALLSTVLGSLLALVLGLIKAWPSVSELHHVVLIGLSVILPTLGWTVGVIALGLGAITGAACAASGGALWAGLEWAVIGACGAALGLGIAYGSWSLVLVGSVWAAITAGSVGLSIWLCCTDRATLPVERGILAPYLAALTLIALYVPLALDWMMGTLSG